MLTDPPDPPPSRRPAKLPSLAEEPIADPSTEPVRPGAAQPSPIRPDATFPDPMDRPDGGPRLPEKLHAGGLIPEVVPPLPRESPYARALPWTVALGWLRAGWRDLWRDPGPSLAYGAATFAASLLVLWLLLRNQLHWLVFPAISGFLILGPLAAMGLYEKSRRLEAGERVSLAAMALPRPRSGTAALFMGVLLLGLFLLWQRSSVLLWALFFGLKPFPGFDEVLRTLLLTPTGWALLATGGAVGALFAAFAFAISAVSFPMLLQERTDALSAMGISLATVWANLAAALAWGAIVLALFALSVLTGFLGLVLVFPLLGHGTWHAYRALRPPERQEGGEAERMFVRPA